VGVLVVADRLPLEPLESQGRVSAVAAAVDVEGLTAEQARMVTLPSTVSFRRLAWT
jgi:hypothetical protein